MFERYSEKARRVIFFGRFEASQFGSPYIETEHLLLGLLREDKSLTNRFLRAHASVESIRKQIDAHTIIREKIPTSVDLPLSNESKRVLAYAAEEAERLGHKNIGTEHLLLGLLREEKCFAAEMLKERGIDGQRVREELAKSPHVTEERPAAQSPMQTEVRDLTRAAIEGQLEPVIGRDREINAAIAVLSKFRNGNLLLVGEPGAGKTAIVEALAQRIGDGSAPTLTGSRVMEFDTQLTISQLADRAAQKAACEIGVIVFVGDLRFVLRPGFGFGTGRAAGILRNWPFEGQVRCIATSTPNDYEERLHAAPWLKDVFCAIFIRPFGEKETLSVLNARKARYESFHEVSYSDEALQSVVKFADRYLPNHALPGKALELLDAAAVSVKLRRAAEPEEILECQKRIKFIEQRKDSAIANHEFEKARFYSDEEGKERLNLRVLREKYPPDETISNIVGPENVEAVIARWSDYPFKP